MMFWWTWGRLFRALLIGLALATVGRFFADKAWRLDILADFQVQYVTGAGVLLLAALLTRRIKEAALALVLLAVNGAVLAPHIGQLLPGQLFPITPAVAGQPAMKVVSLNLNFNNQNTDAVVDYLRR
jgi:hypothetical protein